MKPPAVGGVVALAVVLVDQIVKAGVLSHFDRSGIDPSPLGPFLNLTLQMNRGISFSLFARDSASAQVALLALTLAVVGLLTWWLFRSRSVLPAAGLGLIIGGALGNAIDRLAHGAVVDYLDLHAFGRHFFVFNVADAAINVGVALLILDLLLVPSAPKSQSQGSPPRARAEIAEDRLRLARRDSGSCNRHRIAEIGGEIRRRRSVVATPAEGKRYGRWALVCGQRWSLGVSTSASLVSSPAWAGDDGDAPLWKGIGSIFGPVLGPAVGFGFGGEKPPPIEYREHGKLVLPPNTELPPPGSSATADPAWPVNQEIVRRKAQKEEGKKTIAGVGDARLRYTHGFPANEPVTVRSVTPDGQTVKCEGTCGSDFIGARQP